MPVDKNIKNRIVIVIVFVVFAVLFLRVFWLQIIYGEKYKRLSIENCVRQVIVKAPRGSIYDSRKRILADTKPGYTIYLPKGSVSPYLEDSLKLQFIKSENFRIVRDIPFRTVCIIEERGFDISDMNIAAEPLRRTFFADTICHVIGYMGEISKGELDTYTGYSLGDIIGKTGLERQYDRYLKGEDGIRYVEVDEKGREIGIFSPGKQPMPGNNIYLSLDIDLQKVCARAMSHYQSGAIVAINPQNGNVIAYYSKPGFDPNDFSPCIKKELWNSLSKDTTYPLFDRVKNGRYPPASVYKLLITTGCLEEDLVTEGSHMPTSCNGGMYIGNRYFKCWNEHGVLNLRSAIVQSCDVYFYQLGMQLGLERISKYSRIFELGENTGIDLPGESKGLIPDETWYNTHYGRRGWSKGNVANLSIGQGEILFTPLRMANFIAGIANGRYLYTPTLVDSIVSYEGKVLYKDIDQPREIPIDENTIGFIRNAMLGVVQDSKGTGRAARISSIQVAGKTGSAENPKGEDHAWFVCFAPFEEPTIALIVFLENAGMGGGVAAPLAGEILRYLFEERT